MKVIWKMAYVLVQEMFYVQGPHIPNDKSNTSLECLSALSTSDGALWHDTSVTGEKSVREKWRVPRKGAEPTKMTFSMSLDGHQWNIPVESYFFTFSSMLSICSFPGMRSGSCLIKQDGRDGGRAWENIKRHTHIYSDSRLNWPSSLYLTSKAKL